MLENKAILFVSHLIPHECYDEVISNSKNNMQDAANTLQWHLVKGFSYNLNRNYDIINFMPIASFPKYYKKAWIKEGSFDAEINNPAINIGFCNVKYIRRLSIEKSLFSKVRDWCFRNSDKEKIVIVYTLNPIALRILANLKKKHHDITVCAIVADLPDMMNLSSNQGLIKRITNRAIAKSSYSNIDVVDKFVFLTKHMSDYLNNKKPFCVMEGIATDDFGDDVEESSEESNIKTVLYTGTLHRRFGVLHLLEAFSLIEDPDYRLVICGAGDSEREIQEAANRDPRIVFKGQCKREEVLTLQKSATVLVNPRMNNEEYTKYSFPSKNMEYLSSGTPLIAYKLDGIPDEYDSYIRYPDNNSTQNMADAIIDVCEMPIGDRKSVGGKGYDFMMENKNMIIQTKKILLLLSNPK